MRFTIPILLALAIVGVALTPTPTNTIEPQTTQPPMTAQKTAIAPLESSIASKHAPTPTPTPIPTPAPTPAPQIASTPISGSKTDWMRMAGIPQSDWAYVDFIVTRESGWNPNARNPSSGACGLAQFLPCSVEKAGANWNDPVNALRRQHRYVVDRYGSYQGAYAFWLHNRYY